MSYDASGVLLILTGAAALYARWSVPRALLRARARAETHGRGGEKIDTTLASRRWRMSMAMLVVGGVAGLVAGVAFFVS